MTPDLLRRARLALGYSQLELAERLGVQKTTVHRWERGHAPIGHPERLMQEMRALLAERQVEIDELQQEMDAAA